MKKINGYWIARLVVKWLIPVMFLLNGIYANSLILQIFSVLMVPVVVTYYLLVWQGVGKYKYIKK